MWWEFKLILSAVVVFVASFAWKDWTDDSPIGRDRRNTIYSRIAFVCLAVAVFAILWLLWMRGHSMLSALKDDLGFIERP